MLNFLPALLIVLMIVLVLALPRTRFPIGTVWLFLALFTLLNWAALIFLRFHLPSIMQIGNWFPVALSNDPIELGITKLNWPVLFGLAAILCASILSGSSSIQEPRVVFRWVEELVFLLVGMISTLAQSLLAFLLAWALIDLMEIILFASENQGRNVSLQTITILISRVVSLGLLISAMALGYQDGQAVQISALTGFPLTLVILAAAVRLGVFPLRLPYTQSLSKERITTSVFHYLPALSTFVLLSQIPRPEQLNTVLSFVLLFAILSVLFGAMNWTTGKNEEAAEPYWLVTFSGLAFVAYFHGQPAAVITLALLMVVIGGWISLEKPASQKFDFWVPVAFLTFTGIPFTPGTNALVGLTGSPWKAANPLLWLAIFALTLGLLRFSLIRPKETAHREGWMRLFATFGMGILLLTPWLDWVISLDTSRALAAWLPALVINVLLAAWVSVHYLFKVDFASLLSPYAKLLETADQWGRRTDRFLHFEWLYRFLGSIYSLAGRIMNWFNTLMEEQGGVLWAIVFFALLLSLLLSRGVVNG
jgi:hypothetical protein